MSTQKVLDTHIHLAVDWKKGGAGLPNGWLPSEPESFQKEWAEVRLHCDVVLFHLFSSSFPCLHPFTLFFSIKTLSLTVTFR